MKELNLELSLIDILDDACNQYADAPCVEFNDTVYTYKQVQEESVAVARALQKAGFKKGMHAAVYSLNSATVLMLAIGIVRAGGVWIPVNPRNSEADNIEVLKKFGCQALFYQSVFQSAIDRVEQNEDNLISSICVDSLEAGSELSNWLKDAENHTLSPVNFDPADPVTLPQTGGTTGLPKGVILSHRNFAALSYAMHHMLTSNGNDPRVVLCAAPMTHVGGRIAITSMTAGAKIVVLDKVDPQRILQLIPEKKISDFFLPPTAIYALLDQPNVQDVDFSSLKMIGYGSAPMSIERLKEAINVFGPVMSGGFGQTECPMFITSFPPEDHLIDGKIAPDSRLRSVGRHSVISEVAIFDENFQPLPANERGEIVVRGPNASEGYYNAPEETAKIRHNEWHLTGDIGYMDDDGFVFIVDRKKDMIITGGFNVYSAEVEQTVSSFSGVSGVAVVGIPSDQWGEEVKAVITVSPGSEINTEELIAYAKEKLGSVKAPKSVDIVEAFPTTPLGKIDKKVLRATYWEKAGRVI